jgi:hypothetical protein
LSAFAIAAIRRSAAIASAAGSSRAASAALPEPSRQVSTLASARAFSGPSPERGGVYGQDHGTQRRAELPSRHRPGEIAEPHRDRRRGDVIKPRELVGEDHGLGPVDPPLCKRSQYRWQPREIPGKAKQTVSRAPGQGERGSQLRADVFAHP